MASLDSGSNRKIWVGGGILVIVIALLWITLPIGTDSDGAAGTIGKRNVYRADQMSASDIIFDESLVEGADATLIALVGDDEKAELFDKAELANKAAMFDRLAMADREALMNRMAMADREKFYSAMALEDKAALADRSAMADKATMADSIPAVVFDRFQRVGQNYNGQAMAAVTQTESSRNAAYCCSGCYMSITIDTVEALMSKDDIKQCPNCQRLLYIAPDEA